MKQLTDSSRRHLLKTTAGALVTTLLVPSRTAFGFQDAALSLVTQAFAARDKGNYPTMEALLRRAVDAGRTDEGVLRSLAWSLSRQWKHEEAIRIALDNNQRNPCAWSVAEVCDAYVSAGDYDNGRKWLRYAMEHKSQWDSARPAFEAALELAAIKTYRLEYTLDPDVLAQIAFLRNLKGDFLCPVPIPDLPYQTSNYEVSNARSVREERRAGNLSLRIAPQGSDNATVRFTVTITPQNYRAKVRDFTLADVPEGIQRLTRATRNVEVGDDVVQTLALPLRDRSAITTIENVCNWSRRNIKYTGNGGGGSVASLQRRGGHCEGCTSGTVGLLRAVGIPARFVRGHGAIVGASGVPTDHSWTEFYVPSAGWIQWDGENMPFTVPARICIGTFRYTSPYDAPGMGDSETLDLWNFEAVLFPAGTTPGKSGNAHFTRIRQTV